jgi:hypothetical protein
MSTLKAEPTSEGEVTDAEGQVCNKKYFGHTLHFEKIQL